MITHSFFCLREGIYSMMKKQIKNILVTESQLTRLVNQLKEDDKNPCWDGYEMIGMKEKDGKEVPNCVPIEEELLQEAEYQGRKVKLNKPTRMIKVM